MPPRLADLTNPNQSVFVATSGEMLSYTPSIAGSRPSEDVFESQDPRRETFSNPEAVASPESVTSIKLTNNSAILDMTNPTYSVPGADFLLATEYIVGGMVYDAGEVLDDPLSERPLE